MNIETTTAEFDPRRLGQAFLFYIEGLTPLLTHNPASMLAPKKARGPKVIPPPEEEAAAGCYRLPDGEFALPSLAFRECLIRAARDYPVHERKRGRVVPMLSSFLGHAFAVPELVVLRHPQTGEPLRSYEIDRRRTVIRGVGAVIRARPRFWPWACEFEIIVDPELVAGDETGPLLERVLKDAGLRIGVGDYRPIPSGGPFGRFAARLRV